MLRRISSLAAVAFFLPLSASLGQGPASQEQPRFIPEGTYPGYEEAKRRANEGLAEPSAKAVVKLSEASGAPPPSVIFSHSFAGDERKANEPNVKRWSPRMQRWSSLFGRTKAAFTKHWRDKSRSGFLQPMRGLYQLQPATVALRMQAVAPRRLRPSRPRRRAVDLSRPCIGNLKACSLLGSACGGVFGPALSDWLQVAASPGIE